MRVTRAVTLALLTLGAAAAVSRADTFQASYLASGVQASSNSTFVENFNSATITNNTLTTTFNGSGITGTYSGTFSLAAAGAYGGAGGTGNYISTGGANAASSYTLSLSRNVNYFGIWISALDRSNDIAFYNGTTLLYDFNATTLIQAVGACSGSSYCGNPNNGQDTSEQFAFVNLFDTNGTFNKIVFTKLAGTTAGFESDNHTLGNLASAPTGTTFAATPEPSSLVLIGTGLLSVFGCCRKRLQ